LIWGQSALTCTKKNRNHFRILNAQKTSAVSDELEKYDVHYYSLDVKVPNSHLYISGFGEIHATARQSIDSAIIQLASGLTVLNVVVDGNAAGFRHSNSILRVPINKNINERFIVKIEYQGRPAGGLFYQYLGPELSVTWNLSEPYSAYHWFPVKQSLLDKADSCDVWITVPSICKAGSNGLLTQITDMGGGWSRYEWKHRHPIAFYLISVAVGNYDEYTITANPVGSTPVTIQNYVYSGSILFNRSLMDKTVDYMELFAEKFGPYPYADEKYGHCLAPMGGGMEHQTMTTQDGFDPHLTSHELAHQWWGNQVTCASWKDIWINEGFASYGEDLMLEFLYPDDRAFFMDLRHEYIMAGNQGSVYVEDTTSVARIFDVNLTYNKGSAIIHTLRYYANNDSLFFAGLKEFQVQYKDSIATGADFVHVMERITKKDFSSFIQEWYYGKGFPTYSIRWNKVQDSLLVELSQVASNPASVEFFTNDVEVAIKRYALPDTILRLTWYGNRAQYLFDNVPDFEQVLSIDPANWIINRTGSIAFDSSFIDLGEAVPDPFEYGYSVRPNPAHYGIQVRSNSSGRTQISLIDVQGKILLQDSFYEEMEIDLMPFNAGVYIVKMMDEASSYCFRVVKQ
jgi:aminopeptidase N